MLKIYGSSDDLIEIDGDIVEEFGVTDSDPRYLVTSNGVVVKVTYDGDWNLKIVRWKPGAELITANETEAKEHTGNDYSDVVLVHGNVEWVVAGTEFVRGN